MKTATLFLIVCTIFFNNPGYGQCPARDSLWKRLKYLKHASASLSKPSEYEQQLTELLGYQSRLKDCPYTGDSTHALLLQQTGALYSRLHEYVKAIACAKQAVSMINSRVQKYPYTAKYLIRFYYDITSYYDSLNKPREKLAAIDSCINTATAFNIPDDYYLYALTGKVDHLLDIGEYKLCYQYAAMGETATGKLLNGADSIDYMITFLVKKTEALMGLKKYDVAEKMVVQQVTNCKKLGAERHLGALYEQLANLEVADKNMAKATQYFQKAYDFQRSNGFKLGCMQTLNTFSYSVYDSYLNDVGKSMATYKKALGYNDGDLIDKDLKSLESLNILANIAAMYSRHGMFDSAQHYFGLAFSKLGPKVNEMTLADHPEIFVGYRNIDYLVLMIIEKGNAFLSQFKKSKKTTDINEAIRIFKVADRLINMLKSEQSELESKLSWRTNYRYLYEKAIEACFESGETEDAFYFMEKSRAVLLSDQLNQQRLLGEDDILLQTQINKKIGFLQKESADINTDPARKQAIEHELFVCQQERDRLTNDIKSRNPLYYQSFLDTSFIRVSDVQHTILKDQKALVELFTGDSAVYLLVITANQMRLSKINKPAFDEAVNVYASSIVHPDLLNQYFDSFINVSRTLYRLMFSNNPLPAGRVIISPDGAYFPFDALVKSNAGEKLSYFMEDHAVSYTYSARYLLNNFNIATANSSHLFIGVAPVKYANYLHVSDLNGSDYSLNLLGNYFPGPEILLSAKASKNNFLQNFSKYQIVQLYTHASDSSASGEPVIYFADSSLSLSELMPENRPATQLMVLSACETGSGRNYQGEGVFSFNRGFASLGIPSSLANLWKVEDASTYRITELFYKYLAQGLPADVALQRAKLDFLKNSSKSKQLPYYWAAPIMTGKVITFDFAKDDSWITIGLTSVAIIISLYFLFRLIQKRRL